jgi:hypothetical protein
VFAGGSVRFWDGAFVRHRVREEIVAPLAGRAYERTDFGCFPTIKLANSHSSIADANRSGDTISS